MEHSEIPFNRPFIAGKELYYIAQAVTYGNIAGDGHFTQACARLMETKFKIPRVLMTPSCTASLEMAAMLCNLGPGDEVIMPSYTFVSTANAVVLQGARPVFVDIRPDTLNMDETLIESAITPQTKAIFPVHYAGVACEMDTIMDIAARHNLIVVEDAAQGVGATYKGRALGSIGHLGTYSFHETKNFTCGEGGALCINAPQFVERAEIIRDKGTNRKQFLRGQTDKYTWVDKGSSYVPSEISCAFLFGQLELMEMISARRRQIYETYRELLAECEQEGRLRLPRVPPECVGNCHMFYVLMPDRDTRDGALDYLRGQGIHSVFHYVPLHSSPMGQHFGSGNRELPNTDDLSGRLIRLPLFFDITKAKQQAVTGQLSAFVASHRAVRVLG